MKQKPSKEDLQKLYLNNTNSFCCHTLGVSQTTLLKWINECGIKRKDSPGRGSNSALDKIVSLWWLIDGEWCRVDRFRDDVFMIAGRWIDKADLVKMESRHV